MRGEEGNKPLQNKVQMSFGNILFLVLLPFEYLICENTVIDLRYKRLIKMLINVRLQSRI